MIELFPHKQRILIQVFSSVYVRFVGIVDFRLFLHIFFVRQPLPILDAIPRVIPIRGKTTIVWRTYNAVPQPLLNVEQLYCDGAKFKVLSHVYHSPHAPFTVRVTVPRHTNEEFPETL